MIEIISLILNLLLGGGFLVTVFTLRAARRKAHAEAQSVEIDNDERSVRVLTDSVLPELRKEIKRLNNEISKFRKAIEKGNTCRHHDACPIIRELHKPEGDGRDYYPPRQPRADRASDCGNADCSGEPDALEDSDIRSPTSASRRSVQE